MLGDSNPCGETYNIIPDEVTIRGTVRTFKPEIQKIAEKSIQQILKGAEISLDLEEIILDYGGGYPPTVNHERETAFAAKVAEDVVGSKNVLLNQPPKMAAEDFSFMLNERPGCYIWLGNGPGEGAAIFTIPFMILMTKH